MSLNDETWVSSIIKTLLSHFELSDNDTSDVKAFVEKTVLIIQKRKQTVMTVVADPGLRQSSKQTRSTHTLQRIPPSFMSGHGHWTNKSDFRSLKTSTRAPPTTLRGFNPFHGRRGARQHPRNGPKHSSYAFKRDVDDTSKGKGPP